MHNGSCWQWHLVVMTKNKTRSLTLPTLCSHPLSKWWDWITTETPGDKMKKTMNSSNLLPPISSVIPCMMRMTELKWGVKLSIHEWSEVKTFWPEREHRFLTCWQEERPLIVMYLLTRETRKRRWSPSPRPALSPMIGNTLLCKSSY